MTAAKLLFAGTPEFALESLRALHQAGHVPAAVLTQPDRPAGRGKKMTQSPVKRFALEHGIPVWQPETLKDAEMVMKISEIEVDLMIVAAYGLLLPQAVLDLPVRGCVNVHASLLPRWRGASPIQAAILEGDTETGVTLMQMEAGLDSGPVLACAAIEIGAEETAGTLHDRLATLGGELLVQKIGEILDGKLAAIPQDDALATYAGKIRKQDVAIDWGQTATQISRKRDHQVLESRTDGGGRGAARHHCVRRQGRCCHHLWRGGITAYRRTATRQATRNGGRVRRPEESSW
jgi:methionyl-tRNA formyltransferase